MIYWFSFPTLAILVLGYLWGRGYSDRRAENARQIQCIKLKICPHCGGKLVYYNGTRLYCGGGSSEQNCHKQWETPAEVLQEQVKDSLRKALDKAQNDLLNERI